MIIEKKNEQGYIYAYASWEVINDKGEIDSEGTTAYIQDLWIHREHRGNGILGDLIVEMFESKWNKECRFVCYHRSRRDDRFMKPEPIYKFLLRTKLRDRVLKLKEVVENG